MVKTWDGIWTIIGDSFEWLNPQLIMGWWKQNAAGSTAVIYSAIISSSSTPTTKNNIFGAKRHSFWSVKTQISDELSSLQPSVLLFILVDESGLPLWVTITTNRVETMSPQGTSLYGQITIDKQIQDGFPGRMTDFHGRFSTSFRYFIGGNIL